MNYYLYFLLITLIINFYLFRYFGLIAKKYNVFDYPDSFRKLHKKKTSLAGSLFVLTNFILLFFYFYFDKNYQIFNKLYFYKNETLYLRSFFSLTFGSIFLFYIGYLDDKYNLSPLNKLVGSVTIFLIAILIDGDLTINIIKFRSLNHNIDLHQLNILFSLTCFLYLNIALNMFDGADLQFGLYVVIIFIILISLNIFTFFLIPLLIGICFFLYLNFKKKTFIGESGINLISFIISFILIKSYHKQGYLLADEIFILFALPSYEVIRLFFTRSFNGKNPMIGDRNHLHHLLLKNFKTKYYPTILILFFSFVPYILYKFYLFNSFYIILFSILIYFISLLFLWKNKIRF